MLTQKSRFRPRQRAESTFDVALDPEGRIYAFERHIRHLTPAAGSDIITRKPETQHDDMSTENETTGTVETMREIAARLNEAADAYYNGRGELMSDFEWDALFDRLKGSDAA